MSDKTLRQRIGEGIKIGITTLSLASLAFAGPIANFHHTTIQIPETNDYIISSYDLKNQVLRTYFSNNGGNRKYHIQPCEGLPCTTPKIKTSVEGQPATYQAFVEKIFGLAGPAMGSTLSVDQP